MEMHTRKLIEGLLGYTEKLAELNSEPQEGDCRETIAAAQSLLRAFEGRDTLSRPTVILEVNGGALYCARSNAPARLIVLDHDVEGSDGERVQQVNGQEFYVAEYVLSGPAEEGQDGVDVAYVEGVVAELDQNTHQLEDTVDVAVAEKDPKDIALRYRVQALALIEQAQAADGLKPFVVTHMHRFGSSAYLLWAPEQPTEEQAALVLDSDYEPERQEGLEIEANLSLDELCGVAVASRLDAIMESSVSDDENSSAGT